MTDKPKSSVLRKDNKRKGLNSNPSDMQIFKLLLDTNDESPSPFYKITGNLIYNALHNFKKKVLWVS